MAFLLQLATLIILAAIIFEKIVQGQLFNEYYDETNNDLSNSEEIKTDKNLIPSEDNQLDNYSDNYDEKRGSRSFNINHLCIATFSNFDDLKPDYVYKPNELPHYKCERYSNRLRQEKTTHGGVCFNDHKCETQVVEVTIHRRKKGHFCWAQEKRNISVGCKCHMSLYHH